MSLVPVGKHTGRKRSLSESERQKQRKEKEKADYYNRNPDSRWNKR